MGNELQQANSLNTKWFAATTFVILLLSHLSPCLAEITPDAKALLEKVDRLYRADSSEAEITMRIKTPDWSREMKLTSISKGMKKTFIRILAPKKDEGVTTLRVNKDMWNYFPKINKVIKVPPSMMMGSWMGSDFTNDDLVRETSWVDEYQVSLETRPDTYLLTLVPKADTATVWGKIEVIMDKATSLPKEQIYYDEKGKKVRTMQLRDLKDFDGRKLPAVMEIIPLNKEGHSTTVIYEKAKFNTKIDEDVFSLRNLQKK